MKTAEVMKEPLVLRVKANGELDKALRAILTNGGELSVAEVMEAGGLRRSPELVLSLRKWFDNVRVDSAKGKTWEESLVHLEYVEIAPREPVSVGTDVIESTTAPESDVAKVHIDKIEWPQAPPLIEVMDNFDKPDWFETMRAMVRAGRHISLESPPGMGKDTAVQQLAAMEGVPLVTVSGDGGFRRRDLVGTAELNNGSSTFQVAEYAAAVIHGWWVLITEVNAADADALLFINNQLAPPFTINVHGKAYPRHPNFRLFVSYNAGLIGTKPLPPAFKDRFYPVKIPFFNEKGLMRRLEKWGLPPLEGGENQAQTLTPWAWAIVQFGVRMHKANIDGKMRYQVTVRRLIDAIDLVRLNVVGDVFKALRSAVIETIDSPIEYRVAEQVLAELRQDFRTRFDLS